MAVPDIPIPRRGGGGWFARRRSEPLPLTQVCFFTPTPPPPRHQVIYLLSFRLVYQVKITILKISEARRRKNSRRQSSSLQLMSSKSLPSPTAAASAKAIRGNTQAWMCHITEMDLLITESGQELDRINVQAIVWLGKRLFPRIRRAAEGGYGLTWDELMICVVGWKGLRGQS